MLISGYPWVIGRSAKEGEIQDVSIETTAEGLNRIQIARDARNTDRKIVVVDRRSLPNGAWKRLLETEAFSEDALPERLSETRAIVEFESIPNVWGIEPEKTWGVPAGMESPWMEPVEMVGNELLLPLGAKWVSGDAPVNTVKDNSFKNGKYVVSIRENFVTIEDVSGEVLARISTDTSYSRWTEGIAGAASFRGGSVYIEPAKPPVFLGSYTLDQTPILIQPGLYSYGDNFIVSSNPINGRTGVGLISFVKDPYPQRWIPRIFVRAYVRLVTPANVPPLVEDEPSRIGIDAYPVPTDFDIEPKFVTPYHNKVGVFNTWELDIKPVDYSPRERPYDILVPFDGKVEDWGGHSIWYPGTFFPANDFNDKPNAAFPSQIPYEISSIPEMREGVAFFRWKDSNFFRPIRNEWLDILYRDGYIYFENAVSPESNGISKIDLTAGWNSTKIEWNPFGLYVNDNPALIEEKTWGEVLGNNLKWGQVGNIAPSSLAPNPNLPVTTEQFYQEPPTWETGVPEGEVPPPIPDYSQSPRTWGRVLYEQFDG